MKDSAGYGHHSSPSQHVLRVFPMQKRCNKTIIQVDCFPFSIIPIASFEHFIVAFRARRFI